MKTKLNLSSILLLLFPLFFISCSPRLKKEIAVESVLYPAAPSVAKIQYLTSISNSLQITKKQTSLQKTVVGEKKGMPIYKPYGVFIRNGKLYICDISLGGLEIIDLENKDFQYFVPQGVNSLKMAINVFVDLDNTRYIVDADLHRVVIFDESGKYQTAFGFDENTKPTGVFVYKTEIFVVDSENHRVNVYDKQDKSFKFYFPKSNPGDDNFLYKPTNLTVENDKVYVSDLGAGDVKIYSLNGKYLRKIGQYGRNIGDFVRPKGVAVDREENLYVVDASFENIQIFNKEGKLLMFFGGHYEGAGGMWLPTSVVIDYDNLAYFEKYVDPKYKLEYLIIVANQFGPDKVNIYGRINPIVEKADVGKNKN